MGLLSQVTGEPCDTETVKHGLVGGGWKSAYLGNSLAAYPTHVRFDVAGNGNQAHAQAPFPDPTSRLGVRAALEPPCRRKHFSVSLAGPTTKQLTLTVSLQRLIYTSS
jgi:hypothetical protein